jgi:transposase
MNLDLSSKEIARLKSMHRTTKCGKKRDRIKAVVSLATGYSVQQVAEILFIDADTLYRWVKGYQNRKTNYDWLTTLCIGYEGKLSAKQLLKLSIYLESNLVSDSKKLRLYIVKEWAIHFSQSGIHALLKRLGYVYKKTTLRPSKYSPEDQALCKDMYEKKLAKLRSEEVILFLDGTHPQHNTRCSHAWIKKGDSRFIQSNTGRQRINIHGAYNPVNQDIIVNDDARIDAESSIAFFKKIEAFYPTKSVIYMYMDNARYYKNKRVTAYVDTSRIQILFLPTYSPNLNLIERLWKVMHIEVINNRYYATFSQFKAAILKFFEECSANRESIASAVGCKMQLFSSA